MGCLLKKLVIPFSLLLFCFSLQAQVRPGIKFGVSTPHVDPKDFIVSDGQGVDLYHIFVEKARYGYHGGIFLQIQAGGFFIQPEALYNSTTVEYRIDEIPSGEQIFTDSYRTIDFPIMLGLKSGPIRLGGGPVAHLHFEGNSGFGDYDGFDPLLDDLTWGWQAGVGLDFWKLHIDLRYEGNFTKLGDHITFFGREFDFATNNNRLLASLGFSF
jgi:hypothetical protein